MVDCMDTSSTHFSVLLVQQLNGSVTEELARTQLANRFKLSPEALDKLLARDKASIKRNTDLETAKKFKRVIEDCGYQAIIIDDASGAQFEHDPPRSSTDSTLELAPITPSQHSEKTDTQTPQTDNIYSAPQSAVGKTVFCRHCGKSLLDTDKICGHCDNKVSLDGGRSKVAAGFLAFFLGGLGVHRYYLGQWWGIFYLIPGILGVAPLITWVEAIYFWSCSKQRWNDKYGHLGATSSLMWVAICILPLIAIVGIMAAVALPAYQDYTHRAKISLVLTETQRYTAQVETFVLNTNFVPSSNLDAGIKSSPSSEHIESIEVVNNGIVVTTLAPFIPSDEPYTIDYTPSFKKQAGIIVEVQWDCVGGSLPDRYRPSKCRSNQ